MKKFLITCIAAIAATSIDVSADTNDDVYLFSYFKGNGEDGLHMAISDDGLTWTALNNDKPLLQPAIGKDRLMRDPSITQGPDGMFHMVWTSGWWDRIIGHASSSDLIHWSAQDSIPVMMHEPEAKNSWAPELFYDDATGLYHIFWATTIPGRHSLIADSEREKGLNHRIYQVTTRDFRTYTPTEMFFNPDFSAIDAAIIKMPTPANDYLMVVKNENPNPPEKNIRVTRTGNIADGFPVQVSTPITGNYWAEGPSPLIVGNYLYVYFDKYRNHRYGAVRSADEGRTWEDVSDLITMPDGIRHGTAFRVDRKTADALLKNFSL